MILYTVTWTARPTPYHHLRRYVEYFGSQESAKVAQRALAKGGAVDVEAVEQVTVPTDKAGLIAFLNANMQPQRVEA